MNEHKDKIVITTNDSFANLQIVKTYTFDKICFAVRIQSVVNLVNSFK
jgi:hypothetical protein